MTLGDLVKKYRTAHRLSMEEFAERAGLTKGYISMLEKNKNPQSGKPIAPSLESFRGVAAAMGININELIASVDSDQPIVVNAIPYVKGRRVPIIGAIPAGYPIMALENIEGYAYSDEAEDDNYFFLRIKGDSMVNARIFDGSLVLIRQQTYADNGQIVACLINGDEATLKRFHQQEDEVILSPENPDYNPITVSVRDFESGYARIIGIVTEVRSKPA